MRSLWVVALACACGGSDKPATTPKPAAPPPPEPSRIAELFCQRVENLGRTGCPGFDKMQRMTRAQCMEGMHEVLDGDKLKSGVPPVVQCVVDHAECAEIAQCVVAASPQWGNPNNLRACDDTSDQSSGVTKFSAAVSSKEHPIEACTVDAENEWLVGLACDDGSHPITDHAAAERVRLGNLGAGGRCGSTIDHYRVACPEKSYDIFIDAYVCPRS